MIILWTILCLVEILGAMVPNPCPDIFQYIKAEGNMRGKIKAPIENDSSEIKLAVKLSIGSRLRDSNFVGKIEHLERSWDESCAAIGQGYLPYLVHFPQQVPIPVVQEISVNNKIVCSGPPASASMITTISLTYTSKFENCPVLKKAIKKPEVIPPPSLQSEFNPPVCGIVGALPTIVHGYKSPRGAFPWYIALYQDNNFICGGSLVSKKYVITAAHCLKQPSKPEIYTVYLGKHDLSKINEVDSIQRKVLSIALHPDYKEHNVYLGDADIAFLTIESVEFTNLIRPICLFIQNVDDTKFIGFKGAIAGWGVDENGQKRANEIKYTAIKVASTEDCKESHYEYRNINRSFCAGGENTGPCLGDSGGGMYFKVRRKWYLRGVVSTSIQDVLDNSGCDTSVYALYTDVLKFKDWLTSFQ